MGQVDHLLIETIRSKWNGGRSTYSSKKMCNVAVAFREINKNKPTLDFVSVR